MCFLFQCSYILSEEAKNTTENRILMWAKIFSLFFSRMCRNVIAKLPALKTPYAFSFERTAGKVKVALKPMYIDIFSNLAKSCFLT